MTRTFLVTGAGSGIGLDLADALVDAGHRVVATDILTEALQRHADAHRWPEDRVLIRRLDVTDALEWDALVAATRQRFGRLDVLCNVAGFLMPGWVHEVDEAAVQHQIDVNFKGVVLGMRATAPGLIEQGGGHIINVASMAALAPIQGIALYCATKYAVRGYSLAAAQELRDKKVAVTVVCPDAVRTPMLELQRDYDEAAMTFSGPRVLEPREVTQGILAALERRPLEVFLPPQRGWLARFADVFPETAFVIAPWMRRRGAKRQRNR